MNIKLTAKYIRLMMEKGLGMDLSDPNLKDTPDRIARMYCNEFFANSDPFSGMFLELAKFPNDSGVKEMIFLDKIHFTSMCAHHFLPFSGFAWIFYIPNEWLIGASKGARLVDHFSRRPQLQENLCQQVLNAFVEEIQPVGAMVFMRAVHGCMACRGVRQYAGSGMGASALYGCFAASHELEDRALKIVQITMQGGW